MAMERYNPTARASSRQMPSNGATPGNLGQGDPVNGYPFGSTTPGYIDYRDPSVNGAFYPGTTRQQYRDDPNARKLHTPGSSRGEQSGYNPSVSPRTEWVPPSAEWYAQDEAAQAQRRSAREQIENQIPGYADAKAAGDWRTMNALMMAAKNKRQRDDFIAQGGQGSTWDNRFSNENNWPRPTSSIGYSHGPGRPDFATRGTNPSPYGPGNTAPPGTPQGGGVRHGATPQANAPMSGGMPPMQNPMFQGYQSGGAGVSSGGSGNWGPAGGRPVNDLMYVPGRDGGANPYGGFDPNTPSSGADLNRWLAMQGGGNPFAGMGSGETDMMYPGGDMTMAAAQGRTAPWQGTAPGGRQPIGPFNPTIDPSTRPGSAPSWASAQPGYTPFNPGNFSMPYDTGGMWQMFGGSPMGGGMNYAQMQNYLGLQPQGAPNWIGL